MIRARILLPALFTFAAVVTVAAQSVTVKVPNCAEPMYRFRFNGVLFVKEAPLEKTGDFTYALPNAVEREGIAYVGPESGSPIPLVLDGKESFTVSGNCAKMNASIILGSDRNDAYNALKQEFKALEEESNSLNMALRTRKPETPAFAKTKEELKASDDKKLARLTELREANEEFFASVLAVNIHTSFANTEKPYSNELIYFINERFQHTDFSNPIYANNPWVFESYRAYTTTLIQAKIPAAPLEESLNTQLDLVYNNRPVHKLALGGVIATLKAAQSPLAATFAKQYLKRYAAEEPEAVPVLQADIKRLAALEDGAAAPEFTQASIDGTGELGPQDFRGKVLLIDFWASWCGPCRRENPNVVRMYNEHKDQGFEILGVSLDKRQTDWERAVAKDGLTWPQVSDLRGWQNAAAQMYGVRSIPATVLLDRQGKIIARNLRGAALEAKVAEVLASDGEG